MPRTRPHVAHRASDRPVDESGDESGLALLDVMLGMAIFALIAVIAIQGNQLVRERAYETQATAAAKDLSMLLSARVADDATLPAQASGGTPVRTYPNWGAGASYDNVSGIDDAKLTAGVEVSRYTRYADGKSFVVCMVHRTNGAIDAYAGYHSPSGKIVHSGTGTPPATGANPCDGAS